MSVPSTPVRLAFVQIPVRGDAQKILACDGTGGRQQPERRGEPEAERNARRDYFPAGVHKTQAVPGYQPGFCTSRSSVPTLLRSIWMAGMGYQACLAAKDTAPVSMGVRSFSIAT